MRLYLLFIVVAALTGCSAPRPGGDIDRPGPEIRERAETIDDHAEAIQDEADAGETVAPELPHWAVIWQHAATVREQAAEIDGLTARVDALSAARSADRQKIRQLEEELEGWQRRFLIGLWASSVLAFAVGVAVALFVNAKLGGAIMVGAIICATTAWLFMEYAWIIYTVGGAVIAGVVGWIAYRNFWLDQRVLPQVIDFADRLKPAVEDWQDDAQQTQDTAVQRTVQKKRAEMDQRKLK